MPGSGYVVVTPMWSDILIPTVFYDKQQYFKENTMHRLYLYYKYFSRDRTESFLFLSRIFGVYRRALGITPPLSHGFVRS